MTPEALAALREAAENAYALVRGWRQKFRDIANPQTILALLDRLAAAEADQADSLHSAENQIRLRQEAEAKLARADAYVAVLEQRLAEREALLRRTASWIDHSIPGSEILTADLRAAGFLGDAEPPSGEGGSDE